MDELKKQQEKEEVIKTVKRIIGATRLTAQQIAEKIGSSEKSVNRWATGKNVPSLRYFIKIIDINLEKQDKK